MHIQNCMKRIAWLTDIHLNFVDYIGVVTFTDRILKENPDVVLIGGDIGEADSVVGYLLELEKLLDKEIYFVLGNHDYYKGAINEVRAKVRVAARHSTRLRWLPDIGIAELTPTVGLIGHGSWPDGHYGDWERSDLLLNDYFFINEFNPSVRTEGHDSRDFFNPDPSLAAAFTSQDAKQQRLHTMQVLAEEAAQHFAQVLPKALRSYDHVVVLYHVPQFREACWYAGKPSDNIWLPHFSCKAVGDVLRREMEKYPRKEMTVLCGHTHGKGEAQILDNLQVFTGGAAYGKPKVQRIFEFE
ncbi:MAG: metallophosphoesterase [Candidatus Zixiibacteriota bacterium]